MELLTLLARPIDVWRLAEINAIALLWRPLRRASQLGGRHLHEWLRWLIQIRQHHTTACCRDGCRPLLVVEVHRWRQLCRGEFIRNVAPRE